MKKTINIEKIAPNIIELVRLIIEAGRKNSDEGVKYTAKEWEEIGVAAGILVIETLAESTGHIISNEWREGVR